jgi:hypothetical protein
MNPKIKNIIILVGVIIVLVLIYVFFIKKTPTPVALTSSSGAPLADTTTNGNNPASTIGSDFVSVLLSVKNIKLDDSVFQNPAFLSLKDSTIILVQDGNEGRPNPFAPIGSEATVAPSINTGLTVGTPTTTPGTPDTNASTNTGTPNTSTTNTNTATPLTGTNTSTGVKKN